MGHRKEPTAAPDVRFKPSPPPSPPSPPSEAQATANEELITALINTQEKLFDLLLDGPKTWQQLAEHVGDFKALIAVAALKDRGLILPRPYGGPIELDADRCLKLIFNELKAENSEQ